MNQYKQWLYQSNIIFTCFHTCLSLIVNPFVIYKCYQKIRKIKDLNVNKSYNILSVFIIQWLMMGVCVSWVISIGIIAYGAM